MKTRKLVILAIKTEWPTLYEVPILPNGRVPLANDLVMTKAGYRIAKSKAGDYGLPSNSPLLTD
jgi:hypothetical protein